MIVRAVAGERAVVHTLLPPGGSPHTYAPRPSDLRSTSEAVWRIRMGGRFDPWADTLFRAAQPGVPVTEILSLPDLHLVAAAGHHHAQVDHGGDEVDAHCWLDPVRVETVIGPQLVEVLVRLDPAGADYFRGEMDRFAGELRALHAELSRLFSQSPPPVVSLHPAWSYFSERYGLGELPVVERVPGEAPSPRALAELIREARRVRAERLLVEPQLPASAARAIAEEIGATVVLVDPLGDPRDPARADYSGLLRFNAYAIAGVSDTASTR